MDEVKNTNFDELPLSKTVRKFPCFYDKTKSDTKTELFVEIQYLLFRFFLFQASVFSSF